MPREKTTKRSRPPQTEQELVAKLETELLPFSEVKPHPDSPKDHTVLVADENALFKGIAVYVRKIVYRKIPFEDVDDVAQDICLHAWKSFASFNGDSALNSWVNIIARNRICVYYRSKERDVKSGAIIEDLYKAVPTFTMPEASAWDDKNMDNYVRQLSDDKRHILSEMLLGKSLAEIAREDNMPYSTVRGRYRRATKKLRQKVFSEVEPHPDHPKIHPAAQIQHGGIT